MLELGLSQNLESKRKNYMIDHLKTQITSFYWPLYLHLIRYRQLVDRYKEFKAGHFSLNFSHASQLKERERRQ